AGKQAQAHLRVSRQQVPLASEGDPHRSRPRQERRVQRREQGIGRGRSVYRARTMQPRAKAEAPYLQGPRTHQPLHVQPRTHRAHPLGEGGSGEEGRRAQEAYPQAGGQDPFRQGWWRCRG
ncbi:unnamed protein product, partial [Ectocarpus sp. 13 AM-2016]